MTSPSHKFGKFGWGYNEAGRPAHQAARGPRHGNNRKMYAKLKVTQRRRERARAKQEMQS